MSSETIPTTGHRRNRRWAVVLVIVVAVIGLILVGFDRPAPIHYYRTINDYAIAVGTITGPNTWTRVTGVSETDSQIIVDVKSMTAPLPGTGGDDIYELTVLLAQPIGTRAVIDGNTGLVVARLNQSASN